MDNLETALHRYEQMYNYAVRTPRQGIDYSVNDAKQLREQATLYKNTLEQELARMYAARIATPETVDERRFRMTQCAYQDALDYKRRAEQLVWNRRFYAPRKMFTYATNIVGTIKNVWRWLWRPCPVSIGET